VVHLSLRYCAITSLGAKYLGESLGGATHQNTQLVSLDLAGNSISDAGASHLADGLRLNRTLLVLNLSGNGIGDLGATQLATVLTAFELTHDEVVERRRLEYIVRQRSPGRQPSGSKLLTAKQLSASSSGTSTQRGGRKRGGSPSPDHGKTPKPTGKGAKSARQGQGELRKEKSGARLKKSGQLGRGLDRVDSAHSVDESLPYDSRTTPLLSAVVLRQSTPECPTVLVRGNRSLVSLNLCRNEIGLAGMRALLDAVLSLSRDPAVPGDPAMPGLLRVNTRNNRPR